MLEWWENHFRPATLSPYKIKAYARLGGKEPEKDAIEFFNSRRDPALETLSTFLSKYPGQYLCGEHLSIADLQIFFELTDEFVNGRENFKAFPRVEEYFQKML
mmetsp:Transcript_37018/g.27361  ORF Transcript_37018/g.27361 Transcript_37018/m.27361 type:complete len:103 (+) Transcript_37018:311-619(+)